MSRRSGYDAFLSHATPDKDRALEICRHLEARGLRCWIAPRDIPPAADYGSEIVHGIRASRCLVLVLSSAANDSSMVRNEVERAMNAGKPIFPVRVEEILPSPSLEIFVSSLQWIDAWSGKLVDHLDGLVRELAPSDAAEDEHDAPTGSAPPASRSRRWRVAALAASAVLTLAVWIISRASDAPGPTHAQGAADEPASSPRAIDEETAVARRSEPAIRDAEVVSHGAATSAMPDAATPDASVPPPLAALDAQVLPDGSLRCGDVAWSASATSTLHVGIASALRDLVPPEAGDAPWRVPNRAECETLVRLVEQGDLRHAPGDLVWTSEEVNTVAFVALRLDGEGRSTRSVLGGNQRALLRAVRDIQH